MSELNSNNHSYQRDVFCRVPFFELLVRVLVRQHELGQIAHVYAVDSRDYFLLLDESLELRLGRVFDRSRRARRLLRRRALQLLLPQV